MTLREILEPIDKIEDDEEFVGTEHEAVREYYYDHKGKISQEERDLLAARGFDEWMDAWDLYMLEDGIVEREEN